MRQILRHSGLVLAALLTVVPAVQAQPVAPLYRLFLVNAEASASLVSFGEFARLDDRVVFSLPLGDLAGEPRLHLVTLPSDVVDWPTTERYTLSARYANYIATRAEDDFGSMSLQVAEALNRIALTDDSAARLRLAEDARRTLVEWPQQHFGYRGDDIRQYVALLDEIVSELRVVAGGDRFDLSLVAVAAPPTQALLPVPDLRESVTQAMLASRLTDVPAERVSLLESVIALLDRSSRGPSEDWMAETRARAVALATEETRLERGYAEMVATLIGRADARAREADVRGVERVLREIADEDAQLGRRRPITTGSLRVAVEQRLAAARELRLARDQWRLRSKAYDRYAKATRGSLAQLVSIEPLLDDIKDLAGPDARDLDGLEARLAEATREFSGVIVPAGMQTVHGLIDTALQFADSAVRKRREAVASGDIRIAWDASSAAAAAVMLRAQAEERLDRRLAVPELR